MKDVIKKTKIGQFEKGAFTNRDFKKDEVVIRYNLKYLTKKEFKELQKKRRILHTFLRDLFISIQYLKGM